MSRLEWAEVFPGTGCFTASGAEATYLLTAAPGQVMLSRYVPGKPLLPEIQVTLNIIVIPAMGGPTRMAAMAGLKSIAQRYENGEDIEDHRAWDRRAA